MQGICKLGPGHCVALVYVHCRWTVGLILRFSVDIILIDERMVAFNVIF